MAHTNGSPDTLEKHQHEVCSAFARAAVAMRDAAHTAEKFSVWFSRVNDLQNVPIPPMFNDPYNFNPQLGGSHLQESAEPEQTSKKRKSSGDQEGKKKRPAKEKKPHDPNAPKRPPSAYLLFQNDVRKTVKGQHPEMPYGQVLAEISKLWYALTPEERAPYMQATADSKVVYEKAKATYDATSPTEAKDPAKEALTKPPTSKSKTLAASPEDKSAVKATATSDDDDTDDEDESSSTSSDKPSGDNDDEEEEEVPEPTPEPPRKKSKKEVTKETVMEPSPIVKVDKKKKRNEEGKKKK